MISKIILAGLLVSTAAFAEKPGDTSTVRGTAAGDPTKEHAAKKAAEKAAKEAEHAKHEAEKKAKHEAEKAAKEAKHESKVKEMAAKHDAKVKAHLEHQAAGEVHHNKK